MNTSRAVRSPLDVNMFINGDFHSEGGRKNVLNPAHPEEVVGTVIKGTSADVDLAVAAARQAQPAWAAKTFRERASLLATALDAVEAGIEDRARILVRENGKTLAEATNELKAVSVRGRLTLALAEEMDRPRELPAPAGKTSVRYLPYGVVVAIVPWNSPVTLASMQILPALLTGNTVVLKVPDTAPLALTQTATLMAQTLPPGVLNIISGAAADIGDALTLHPDIRKITFVGSVASAQRIIANAGQSIKSVTAELGGNDPAIVLEDFPCTIAAMERLTRSAFRMAGQVCMNIKRIYVADQIHDQFYDAFCETADRMLVGDGLAADVAMGPLHNAKALDHAKALLEAASHDGARITQLGRVDDQATFDRGYFMRPTVVTEVSHSCDLVAEEQFCPIVPIVRYRDLDEALALANDTIFGLGGSVWTSDIDRGSKIANQIQAGSAFVNTHGTESVNRSAPYGGVKQSGGGRRSGIEGLLEYVQTQTLTTFDDGHA